MAISELKLNDEKSKEHILLLILYTNWNLKSTSLTWWREAQKVEGECRQSLYCNIPLGLKACSQ